MLLTNVLANKEALSAEESIDISNKTKVDTGDLRGVMSSRNFTNALRITSDNPTGSNSSLVTVDQGLFKGLFIINIPLNPCPKNQMEDRRGRCRKFTRFP